MVSGTTQLRTRIPLGVPLRGSLRIKTMNASLAEKRVELIPNMPQIFRFFIGLITLFHFFVIVNFGISNKWVGEPK